MMDFEQYRNKMTYPNHPQKPCMGKNPTPALVREYADKLEQYEKEMEVYRAAQKEYNKESGRLHDQFRKDALEDVGLTNHPKADKAYSFAWEHGHSSGFSDVYSWLCNAADLLKD